MPEARREIPRNCVYVSRDRRISDYVIPVMTMLNNGEGEIVIKSRGSCNNNNLSLSQYLLNKVLKGKLRLKGVVVGTDELKNRDGRMVAVTTLAIYYLKV